MIEKLHIKKITTAFCRVLSVIFYPMFIPFYGIYLLMNTTPFSIYMPVYLSLIKLIIGVFTLVVPGLILWTTMKMGAVSNFQIDNRRQRTVPYLLTLVSYIVCLYLLYKIRVPLFLLLLSGGVILSLLAVMIINFWWKISAHASSAGGFLGAVLLTCWVFKMNPVGFLIAVVLLCGLVAFARLYLRAHTPAQVLAGFSLGLFCVGILPYIIIMM